MWLDEALLAENLVDPARGLFEPLTNLQVAPIGFLATMKALIAVAGHDELALRALPFLASLAVVPVVYLAVARFAPRTAAVYAGLAAALSPALIRYGDELKPYASDALVGALAVWLALVVTDRIDWRRWSLIVGGGVVILLFSVPGIFLVCGVALALLCATETSGPERSAPAVRFTARAGMTAVGLAVWLAVFAALYFVFYQSSETRNLQAYGLEGFGRGFFLRVRNLLGAALVGGDAESAMPRGTTGVVGLAVAAGIAVLAIRSPKRGLAVVAPVLALGAAYTLGRWPFTVRVNLWCLPSLLILFALSLEELRRLSGRRLPAGAASAVPLLLLVPAAYQAAVSVLDPPRREDTPAAMAALTEIARDAGTRGDPEPIVYVSKHAEPACAYYSAGAPDRWDCQIDGARVVVGAWMPLPIEPATRRAWGNSEAELIERELAAEGWLLLAGAPWAREDVLAATRARGYEVVETRAFEGVVLVRIRGGGAGPG